MELQNGVKVFSRIGLTPNQAKIYLAVCSLGVANATTISKYSGVARPDVYRLMPTLEKLGLIEKGVSVPLTFKAINIRSAVSVLVNRKNLETEEIDKVAKDFLHEVRNYKFRGSLAKDEHQFSIIPAKQAILEKKRTLIQATRNRIDAIASPKRGADLPHIIFNEILKALKGGVKFRLITEKLEAIKEDTSRFGEFRKTGNFEVRYTSKPPTALTIYDNKEVLITTSASTFVEDSPTLWSNNLNLVAIIQEHFELMWLRSARVKDTT